jgi:hypothetical protein
MTRLINYGAGASIAIYLAKAHRPHTHERQAVAKARSGISATGPTTTMAVFLSQSLAMNNLGLGELLNVFQVHVADAGIVSSSFSSDSTTLETQSLGNSKYYKQHIEPKTPTRQSTQLRRRPTLYCDVCSSATPAALFDGAVSRSCSPPGKIVPSRSISPKPVLLRISFAAFHGLTILPVFCLNFSLLGFLPQILKVLSHDHDAAIDFLSYRSRATHIDGNPSQQCSFSPSQQCSLNEH